MTPSDINIRNRKASYEYQLLSSYTAGLMLTGSEIKSVRNGKAGIAEAYCLFLRDELWVRNMHIAEYSFSGQDNHEPKRDRKLLLQARELKKISAAMIDKGLTIIPTRLFISDRGFAKLDIAIAKGKKLHDKRESLKKKDARREMRERRE